MPTPPFTHIPPPLTQVGPPTPPTGTGPAPLSVGARARWVALLAGLSAGGGLVVYVVLIGWRDGWLGALEGVGLLVCGAGPPGVGVWWIARLIRHEVAHLDTDLAARWQHLEDAQGYHRVMRGTQRRWAVATLRGPRRRRPVPVNGQTDPLAAALREVHRRIDALQETPEPARYTPAAAPVPAHYTLITPRSHQITPGDQPTQPLGRVPYTATMQTLIDRALTRQAISIRVCKDELDMHAVDWKAATAALVRAGVLVKRTDRGEGFTLADGLHTEADVRRRLGGV